LFSAGKLIRPRLRRSTVWANARTGRDCVAAVIAFGHLRAVHRGRVCLVLGATGVQRRA
jgi:hypothetical protein